MRFAVVYPEIREEFPGYTGGYSEGIASVCTFAKSLGHEVSLLHLTQKEHLNKDYYLERLAKIMPDLVGISAMSPTFVYARQINNNIRKELGCKTVLGGHHALFDTKRLLSEKEFDFVVVAEAEAVLSTLLADVDAVAKGQIKIPGVLTNINDLKTVYNQSFVEDLSTLPAPDRSFFDFPNLRESKESQAQFMAGRGCPFGCTYCANRRRNQTLGTWRVRMKPKEMVIGEIEEVIAKYDFVKTIFFQDDILPLDRKWFISFAELYSQRIDMPFTCNIHPLLIDEDVCKVLSSMNCTSIQIGLESGNKRIRNEVLKRKMSNEDIISRLNTCHRYGIGVATFNIVGNFSETLPEALETVKLNARIDPVRKYSTVFVPYPGTALNDTCISNNSFVDGEPPEYYPEYTLKPIIKNSLLSPEQIVFLKNYFGVLVRAYQIIPEKTIDSLLRNKWFPYKGFNKLFSWLKPKLIRAYFSIYSKIKSRF